MSDEGERECAAGKTRNLSDIVREVKSAAADREDVVVEMRQAERMRLELLAAELRPVFEDVPRDIENFDFVISSGMQPRLWIDAISHVTMGRDHRTYRFVKDTRLGRVVLAEATDMKPVADQVARYIAECLIERQRYMEGDPQPLLANAAAKRERDEPDAPRSARFGLLSSVLFLLAGALTGALITGALLWERLAAYFAVSP